MSMNVPFVDLRAQHEEVRTEIETAIGDIIDRSSFIGGRYVEAFEAEFAGFVESGMLLESPTAPTPYGWLWRRMEWALGML